MYCKRMVILLVFISLIPIVSSGVDDFKCEDDTVVGSCSSNNEMCAFERNLLDDNVINLVPSERYLFFGKENCDENLNIGDRNFELTETGERFVVEFDGFNFNGEIEISCDNNYLGKVSDNIELYDDCSYCGSCEEEVVEEEVCADFTGDGEVNFEDYFILYDIFGKKIGEENYREDVDLDSDGKVDIDDFFMFVDRFGDECDSENGYNLVEGQSISLLDIVDINVIRIGETAAILKINEDVETLHRGEKITIMGLEIELLDVKEGKIIISVGNFEEISNLLSQDTDYLDLSEEELNHDNWKIKFGIEDEVINAKFLVYDYPIKEINSLRENEVYIEKYANKVILFQLIDFDKINNVLSYKIYSFFTDECNCLNNIQECRNNRCELKPQNKKYGYLYVYESEETYNPEWRENAESQIEKFRKGIFEASNGNIKIDVDILGDYKTDLECWNRGDKTFIEFKEENSGELYLSKLPGSDFEIIHLGLVGYFENHENFTVTRVECDKCTPVQKSRRGETEVTLFTSLNCDNGLMPTEHIKFLDDIKSQSSLELGFDLDNYDEIIVVYGRFGRLDPDGDENNIYALCTRFSPLSTISGFSNLEFAENNLNYRGVLDCRNLDRGNLYFNRYTQTRKVKYEAPGWHSLVHEVLHRFGTVDVYDTAFVIGIDSERDIALEVDPNTDQSIMGNKERICAEEKECTQEELDYIYLDKYNKRKVGIWDDNNI